MLHAINARDAGPVRLLADLIHSVLADLTWRQALGALLFATVFAALLVVSEWAYAAQEEGNKSPPPEV